MSSAKEITMTNYFDHSPASDQRALAFDTFDSRPASYRKRYKFISTQTDSNAARKQARVHVMREVMRRKRLKNAGSLSPGDERLRCESVDKQGSGSGSNQKLPSNESLPTSPYERPQPSNLIANRMHSGWWAEYTIDMTQGKDVGLHSITLLGQGHTDPFCRLPPNMSPHDLELAEYYDSVIPGTDFNFVGRGICNPLRDFKIRESLRDPAVLHSLILAYAARHQSHMQGMTETLESMNHKSMAIYLINTRLSANPYPSDGTIFAALSLTSLEDRWGNHEAAWVHMRGVMQMIRSRGGPKAFRDNWILNLFSLWTDYMICGYDSSGSSLSFDADENHRPLAVMLPGCLSFTLPDADSTDSVGYQQVYNYCEEFINFFRDIEDLARNQHSDTSKRVNPRRSVIFQKGWPLHHILDFPPDLFGYQDTHSRLQITSCVAALIYLNKVLLDHRTSPKESERFLKALSFNIVGIGIDCSHSVELLLWLLINHDVQSRFGSPERPWLIGRMLKVAKRFDPDTLAMLMHTLMAFLMLDHKFVESQSSLTQMDDGTIRKRILRERYESR